MPMDPKKREKLLLIATLVAAGLLVLNYMVITPLSNHWNARQDRIKSLKDTIATGRTLQQNAKTIEEQWNRMFTNTLPVNPTLAESQLFKAFQNWAASSQVNLVSQKPQPKDSEDPAYFNEEWHADVTGNLNQIFNFLYSVESSPMGLKVDSIEVSARDDRGSQLALGLTVSGLILNPPTNNVK